MQRSSTKASCASANDTPCLEMFSDSLSGSHSKRKTSIAVYLAYGEMTIRRYGDGCRQSGGAWEPHRCGIYLPTLPIFSLTRLTTRATAKYSSKQFLQPTLLQNPVGTLP